MSIAPVKESFSEEVNKISNETHLPPPMSDSNVSVSSKGLDNEEKTIINGDINTSDNLNVNGNIDDDVKDVGHDVNVEEVTVSSGNQSVSGNVDDNVKDVELNVDVEGVAASSGNQNGNDADGEQKEEVWEDMLSSGAIMKLIVKKGEPDTRPIRTQTCVIDVDCCLLDGTVVEKKVDSEIVLGECEVVQGLDLALGLMNVGEICQLKIVPRLAYGHMGYRSLIPSNATVLFIVNLKEVKPMVEIEDRSIPERRKEGHKKREIGNWWYERGEYQLAIQCYRRGLDYLDQVETGHGHATTTDETLQKILEDRIVMNNNMAAAQLKLKLYGCCLKSLDTVLQCQPKNLKARYRKAKVYREQNDVEGALNILKEVLQDYPSEQGIKTEITYLEGLLEKQKVKEKDLARRMLGQLPFPPPKPKDTATKNYSQKMIMAVGSVLAIIIGGIIAYRLK